MGLFSKIQKPFTQINTFIKSIIGGPIPSVKSTSLKDQSSLSPPTHPESVRAEINSGFPIPYDFECTFLRIEINNFSDLQSREDSEKILSLLADFFEKCEKSVHRFEGLVHKANFWEFEAYFKKGNHSLLAISAAHEILTLGNELFESGKSTYPLGFSSALASGELHFGSFNGKFEIAGNPMIECIRLLAAAPETDKCSLFFNAKMAMATKALCNTKAIGRHTIKGYTDEVEIYQFSQYREIAEGWQMALKGTTELITFYRSENDITQILALLGTGISSDIRLQLLKAINLVNCQSKSQKIMEAYIELIKYIDNENDDKSLATILSLAKSIFSPTLQNHVLREFTMKCLKNKDARVVANAIELLSHFYCQKHFREIFLALDHPNPRISSNAIIKLAKENLSHKHIKWLDQRISSGDPAAMASGLYALGEIISFYNQLDPKILVTRLPLQKLVEKISSFFIHPNQMVSKQAILAAKKIDSSDLNIHLAALHLKSEQENLPKIYDWEIKKRA